MDIYAIYFSPTRGTKKIVTRIAQSVLESSETAVNCIDIDITLPPARNKAYAIKKDDLLIFGFPVYAGRVPLVLEDVLTRIKGEGTPAIAVAVYGNRDYEDALLEASDKLSQNGFNIISAGAFIAEHSYTAKLGPNRPDGSDLEKVSVFGRESAKKATVNIDEVLKIKGNTPYKERSPSRGIAPDTTEACYDCMQCAISCPTEAISFENPRVTAVDKCILCFACVKICPVQAKVCDNEVMTTVRAWLEGSFIARKEPELFL